MVGYSAQVGGGEVEFENPVPLRKGSARVAEKGGGRNLEMGIARAGQQNDGGGEKTL